LRTFRSLFAALVAAQVAYGKLPEARRVGATRGIVGLMLATSLVESAGARGPARGPALVGSAGALGFATELVGVATGRPVRPLHLRARPRRAGPRRAAARGRRLGDDGPPRLGRGGAHRALAAAAGLRRGRAP
jgi:hypothetical protein